MIAAVALYYWWKGPIGGHGRHTGRRIERFTPFERVTHWSTAIAFVILAVSGAVMAFGKFLLLPLIGGPLFGWLTYALKTLHNFVGPLFAVSVVIMFITFCRATCRSAKTIRWLTRVGGMLGGEHPPSDRFNAGEKIVFWGGLFVLATFVIVSGLVLDKLIPGLDLTRPEMQVAHMVHAVASMLMMAMFIGHIYMGTIGMSGAYRAMRTGYVDEGWAEEHHKLWYDDIAAGKVPAQRSAARSRPRAARRLNSRGIQMRLSTATALVASLFAGAVIAKLPPLTDEAKAKAAETANKAAWTDKVGAYQLCQSRTRSPRPTARAPRPPPGRPRPRTRRRRAPTRAPTWLRSRRRRRSRSRPPARTRRPGRRPVRRATRRRRPR